VIKINTKIFFTAKPGKRAVDRATRRVLSKIGAFVRQRARRSIRKRKRPARPGQPPSSHKGLLKRLIYFGYEPEKKSVVIGPTPLSSGVGSGYGPTTVPELLEEGGTVVATQRNKRRGKRPTRQRKQYSPHPYMRPAMEAEEPKLPDLWRDSVRP